MLTEDVLRNLLGKVTYRPGWKLKLHRPDPYQGLYLSIIAMSRTRTILLKPLSCAFILRSRRCGPLLISSSGCVGGWPKLLYTNLWNSFRLMVNLGPILIRECK